MVVETLKVEMSRKEEIIISLVIAAVFGALFSGVLPLSSGQGGELNVLRTNMVVGEGQTISAQTLNQITGESWGFPPPLYVYEWVDYDLVLQNVSGDLLTINLTRDGKILQSYMVYGSSNIRLNGYGEYRFHESQLDVMLQAKGEQVVIGTIYIQVDRGASRYDPLVGALGFTLSVGLFMIVFISRKKTQKSGRPIQDSGNVPVNDKSA